MKKRFLRVCALLLAPFFWLLFSGFTKDGGIKEITKPYLGVYACESVRLDDRDFLKYFKKISIELKSDGTFSLTAKPKLGKKISAGGGYSYDPETGDFFLKTTDVKHLPEGKMTLQKGKLYIRARYKNKLLFAVFSR